MLRLNDGCQYQRANKELKMNEWGTCRSDKILQNGQECERDKDEIQSVKCWKGRERESEESFGIPRSNGNNV